MEVGSLFIAERVSRHDGAMGVNGGCLESQSIRNRGPLHYDASEPHVYTFRVSTMCGRDVGQKVKNDVWRFCGERRR